MKWFVFLWFSPWWLPCHSGDEVKPEYAIHCDTLGRGEVAVVETKDGRKCLMRRTNKLCQDRLKANYNASDNGLIGG